MNTGIYNSAADALGFTVGGVNRLGVNTTYIGSSVKFLNVDGSSSAPAYSFGSEQGLGIYRAGSGMLGFTSGGSERMRIDSSGNIGIGTTTINARLQLNTSASTKGLIIQAATSQLSNLFEVQDSAGTAKLFVDASGYLNSGYSDFRLYGNGGQPIFRGLDGWTGVWSDAAPTTYFQTGRNGGNTTFSAFVGSSIGRLSFQVDNSGSNGILFGTGNTALPNGYFEVRQGTVTNLVIARSTGNVGIGTTTPNDKLQVIGDIRVGTSTSNGCIKSFDGTGIIGTCSSDERLKTDIADLSDGMLDKLVNLKVVTYRWNDTAKDLNKVDTSVTNYGLIAQNVEQFLPDLVSTDSNGYKQVNYSRIPLYLLKSVQELSKKVAGLFDGSAQIKVKELCIEDVCVTKQQLQQMLQNQNIQPVVNTFIQTTDNSVNTTSDATSTVSTDNVSADIPSESVPVSEQQTQVETEIIVAE